MLCTHKTASSASLVIQKFVPTLLTHISPNSRPFLVGIVSSQLSNKTMSVTTRTKTKHLSTSNMFRQNLFFVPIWLLWAGSCSAMCVNETQSGVYDFDSTLLGCCFIQPQNAQTLSKTLDWKNGIDFHFGENPHAKKIHTVPRDQT